jgi:hypothetical protein
LLELPNRIDKHTVIVNANFAQVIGEVAEVVADTDFEIITEMTIGSGEDAKFFRF